MSDGVPMSLLDCPHCIGTLDPSLVKVPVREKAAAFAKEGSLVRAMEALTDGAGMRLQSAKWVAMHLVRVPGQCQKCGAAIPDEENTHCSGCGALNIRWLARS